MDSGTSIGQTISAARLRAGLSIEELSERTRIRPALLTGMEVDQFDACGGDAYARGHLRSIATALGLDAAALLDQFSSQTGSPVRSSTAAPPIEQPTRIMERVDRSDGLRQLAGSLGIQDSPRGRLLAPIAALLAVIAIAGGLFTFFSHRGTPSAQPTQSQRPSSNPPATPSGSSQPSPTSSPSASPTDSESPTPSPTSSSTSTALPTSSPSVNPAPSAGTTIQITVTGQASWVSAATSKGGDSIFQGLLSAGDSKTFTSDGSIYLVIGDAGAVTLSVNGYDLGTPGTPGQVIRHLYGPGNPSS